MSNLVPEKRVNKNGVLVTKHVRTDSKSKTDRSFPNPSIDIATRKAMPLLEEALGLYPKGPIGDFTLADVNPEALARIEKLLEDSQPSYHAVSNAIGTALGQDSFEECVRYIHNVAAFGQVFVDRASEQQSVSCFVTGLKRYPASVLAPDMDYFTDATDETREKVNNLVEFSVKANTTPGAVDVLIYDSFTKDWLSEEGPHEVHTKVSSADLALYVMDHPENGDETIEMAATEGPLPFEVIKGRLNHEVQAMREGFL